MFEITINNTKKSFEHKVKVIDLIEKHDYSIIACTVNNRLRELSFEIAQDSEVDFLDLSNEECMKIYEASLRYLFAMACTRLYPNLNIKFNYHISRSIFAQVINDDKKFTQEMLDKIEVEMRNLVSRDLPLIRTVVSKEEAAEEYNKYHLYDKIDILQYRPEKTVHLYECDNYLNYMYSYMVPSTGYLTNFRLRLYTPGIIMQYPRYEAGGNMIPFVDERTYGNTLKKANMWAKTCNAETIAAINSHIDSGVKTIEFVNMCESKHNDNLCELGEIISKNIQNIRLIAIAGPSSSGKTTFSNRLRIELMTRGVHPVKISIDDYYKNREELVVDENGEVDLEHINAIDTALFNEHLVKLINGEEVELPIFNFKKGQRSPEGKKVKVASDSPIIIEGIHALNEQLTPSIPRDNKFLIYIAPHIQTNLDNQNPLSTTQFRLLRRIVRDNKFRAFDAANTINIWDSVRRGEFRWIYGNQEGADYVFNSELSYELCVLKKHALPLLKAIDSDSPEFIAANNLIKFLKYYKDIDDKLVPCNSLLREFIGDSCFQDV